MKTTLNSLVSRLSSITFSGVAVLAAALLLAVPVAGNAQETSSAIRGVVTDNTGNPVPNATITVRNEAQGLTRVATTDDDGEYRVRNLPIGEYSVTVAGQGFGSQISEEVGVNLGLTSTVNFGLEPAGAVEEIIVTGSQPLTAQVALGPNASFDLGDLQNAPAINRNITDILRADSRIYVDESRGDINAIQCAGKNSRFNALTVDGVRLQDSFGLNANGYPTERMPFSYDAINQVTVELAPFDVEYGGFSACNINAVTKSGTNEFFGSAFYDYTSDSLRGDSLEGDNIETNSYDENRFGFTLGGPIVRDKAFFFVAYEQNNGVNLFDRGAQGSGAVNEVDITQAELDEILDIARTVYQYDPGFVPGNFDNEDEKLLVKLDWNINDQNRLAFTYNYNDGFNITQSDGDQDEFEFSNHLYERGAELISYQGSLYSDWNDVFSTEVRVSYLELDNRQISVGGTDFGEMRVELRGRCFDPATDLTSPLGADPNNPCPGLVEFGGVDVYLGGDDSRQSNKLDYDVTTIALKGNYYLNGHNLTFGYEREALNVFNLFVQHTETEIRFNSIDLFRQGLADDIYYNNAPSNNPNDAAADWGYETNTVYLQDEYTWDRLTLVAGMRYDWYTSDDRPAENADFVADYGFSNSTNLDGEGLFQPRLGFTFDYSDDTIFRGGVGLYSGGNPNVWLSNNFSANNVLQFGTRGRLFCYTDGFGREAPGLCGPPGMEVQRSLFDPTIVWEGCEAGVPVGPGYCIPGELFDAVAQGTGDNFEINYLDPNFKIPSEWKFALGMTHVFPRDYVFTVDVLITEGQDSAIIKRGDLEINPADPIDEENGGYPNYISAREASFVLTNSSEGNSSFGYSLGLSKAFDNGFDFTLGYAYSDAEDVQPMTSSVAFSNYQNRAFFDPQEEILSPSNYNIEHRFTATARWYKRLFNDSVGLSVALYGSANSGRPWSLTSDFSNFPPGVDDANDIYSFAPFIDGDGLLDPGVGRNTETSSWWRKVDLRIAADFPGFAEGHEAQAFLVVDNLTNLLNDDWGILRQHNFPRTITPGSEEPRLGDASRYEIQFGVQYNF